jgi:hypothetical protein
MLFKEANMLDWGVLVGLMLFAATVWLQHRRGSRVRSRRKRSRLNPWKEWLRLKAKGIGMQRLSGRVGNIPLRQFEVTFGGKRVGRVLQTIGFDGRPDGRWHIAKAGAFCGVPLSCLLGSFRSRHDAVEALVQAHFAALIVEDIVDDSWDLQDALQEFRATLERLLGGRVELPQWPPAIALPQDACRERIAV